MVVGADHAACAKGSYLAIISTTVETANPEAELELAFTITGQPLEKFITVSSTQPPSLTHARRFLQTMLPTQLERTTRSSSLALLTLLLTSKPLPRMF